MRLWTQAAKEVSENLLAIAKNSINDKLTFFIAATDDAWFELLTLDNTQLELCALPAMPVPIDKSYCGMIYRNQYEFLQIEDAKQDQRVRNQPLTESLRIGAYLGVRIPVPQVGTFGTLCAIDQRKRLFTAGEIQSLKSLAKIMGKFLELEYQSHTDELSGLLNRRYLSAVQNTHSVETMTVCLLDIDKFKLVNDELGHDAGDELIRYTGQVLRDIFDEETILIRLGGDEFCICSTNPTELIERSLRQVAMEMEKFPSRKIFISCGISTNVGLDFEDKLKCADLALYEAKRSEESSILLFKES